MILGCDARRRLARGLRMRLSNHLHPPQAPHARRLAGSAAAAEGQWSPRVLGGQERQWEVDLGATRGVLQLAGPDAPKLLQGLVTNDVLHLPVPASQEEGQHAAMAAAFLTNKGACRANAAVAPPVVVPFETAPPHPYPTRICTQGG